MLVGKWKYQSVSRQNGIYFSRPSKGWEVDLDVVEALADQNTVALVIINPGNPCGNVYSYHHLEKVCF